MLGSGIVYNKIDLNGNVKQHYVDIHENVKNLLKSTARNSDRLASSP